MPNIEIKAKHSSLKKAKQVAEELKTDYLGVLHQIDTYYATKSGRLKLREINNEIAQLIPYAKDYKQGPMKSSYSLLPVDEPDQLKEILDRILGEVAIVDKTREVYLIDNVRVHLDRVKDLGEFVEFEAVYEFESERTEQEVKVKDLMKRFSISDSDLLTKSYVDYFNE